MSWISSTIKQSEVIIAVCQFTAKVSIKRLLDECKLINVHVHDNLIIVGNEMISLADKGLI